jgi:hypothetical protein
MIVQGCFLPEPTCKNDHAMLVIFNDVIVTGAACPRALWPDKLRKFMALCAEWNHGNEFNRNLIRLEKCCDLQ